MSAGQNASLYTKSHSGVYSGRTPPGPSGAPSEAFRQLLERAEARGVGRPESQLVHRVSVLLRPNLLRPILFRRRTIRETRHSVGDSRDASSQSQGARIASFAQDSTGSPALVSSLGGMIGMPCSPRRVVFHALAATHACHAACNMQPHCNGRPPDGCGLSRARPLRHAPAGDRRRDATSLTAICQIRCMSSAAARPM